ncbi:hypothetical protein H0H93_003278, partial [Arthromyces matolae]
CRLTPSAVPFRIEIDNVPALLAREPTDESGEDDKVGDTIHAMRNAVEIPHGFLPADILGSTHELKMSVPGRHDFTWWGSVVNILNLMDAAVHKNTDLQGPRDQFQEELNKSCSVWFLENVGNKPQNRGHMALLDQRTEGLDLEAIRKSIEKAVKDHNEFQGEIRIPNEFLCDDSALSMKVPYPNNADAVESVKRIIELMRSAIGNDAEVQTRKSPTMLHLSRFRTILVRARFGLVLPLAGKKKQSQLTKEQLGAIRNRIEQAVEQHNGNRWLKEEGLAGPQELYELSGDNNGRWSLRIPRSHFVPKSYGRPQLYLKVPSQSDEKSVVSMNNILELMARVGGSDRLQTSWHTVRNRLVQHYQLNVIKNPSGWGPKDESKAGGDVEATEARKEMVLEAVNKNNDNIGERRGKRKAEGTHDAAERPKTKLDNKPQVPPPAQSQPATQGTSPHLSQHNSSHGTVIIEGATSQGGANTEPLTNSVTAAHAHDEHGRMRSPARVGTYYDPIRDAK